MVFKDSAHSEAFGLAVIEDVFCLRFYFLTFLSDQKLRRSFDEAAGAKLLELVRGGLDGYNKGTMDAQQLEVFLQSIVWNGDLVLT